MNRRGLILAAVAAPTLAAVTPAEARASLNDTLRPVGEQHGLPALAAAVVRGGTIIASGALGTRRAGAQIPVTMNDRFHIGSDTKAMTALLAAVFVEQGALHWNSTLGAVFPELAGTMNVDLRAVTLEQLLSHTSGLPSDNEAFGKLLNESFAQEQLNLDELRYWLLKQVSSQPLAAKPGTKWAYSNLGYTIAGAITERTGKRTWEELVFAHVFQPLGLTTAGFGPQSSLGRVDAPLGHLVRPDGTLKPMLAGPDGDNPLIIGPAGTVHLSIIDFATWAAWNAAEGKRGPRIVRPDTVRRLHAAVMALPPRPDAPPGTPSAGSYALGWGIASVPYSRDPIVTHNGSNTMNLASIVLQPGHDFGMVMATNVGGENADRALKALAEQLYRRFGPAPMR